MKTPSALLFLCVLGVAGCASDPGLVHLSGNDYMITRVNRAGVFASMNTLKVKVIQEANAFAAAQGKVAQTLGSSITAPYAQFASYEYTFRLTDATNAPALTTPQP